MRWGIILNEQITLEAAFFQRIPFKSLKYRRHNPYDSHAPQSVPFN